MRVLVCVCEQSSARRFCKYENLRKYEQLSAKVARALITHETHLAMHIVWDLCVYTFG